MFSPELTVNVIQSSFDFPSYDQVTLNLSCGSKVTVNSVLEKVRGINSRLKLKIVLMWSIFLTVIARCLLITKPQKDCNYTQTQMQIVMTTCLLIFYLYLQCAFVYHMADGASIIIYFGASMILHHILFWDIANCNIVSVRVSYCHVLRKIS